VATDAETTSPCDLHEIGCFATTLLASVERCSKPDICTKSAASPPRCLPAWSGVQDQISARNRLLRHHAACQRGAVFKTRYLHEIGCFATTLLASVERCSRPDICTKSAASPPRCSPAWSGVQDQISARNRLLRHHAACQRGAVFKMLDSVAGRRFGLGRRLVRNMAPRWQAAWWPKGAWRRPTAGAEHGSTLASSVVAKGSVEEADGWCGTWLHAGKQRGGRRERGGGRRLVLNMAPRWQAAWWPKSGKLFRPPLLGWSAIDTGQLFLERCLGHGREPRRSRADEGWRDGRSRGVRVRTQ